MTVASKVQEMNKKKKCMIGCVFCIGFLFLMNIPSSAGDTQNHIGSSSLILTSYNVIPERKSSMWVVAIAVGEPERDDHGINALTDILAAQGCPPDHILYLLEENATNQAILHQPFEWLQTKDIQDDDVVLFYICTHGQRIEDQYPLDEPDGYDECLIPYDHVSENYIRDEVLSEKFNTLDLKNLVLIFETCYSGGMIDGTCDLASTGRIILTSCQADESSWPLYLRTQWLFPHYLFLGLEGPADLNKDQWISAEEVYQYAEVPTIKRSTLLAHIFSFIPFIPHEFYPQHPQLYDGWPSQEDNSEDLPLFHVL
jgi:hypothetical protein